MANKTPELTLDVGERPGRVPKQQEFVMDDITPFLLARGGRGSAKTVSGWARMLRRRWDYPKTKGIALAPDYNKLKDGIIQTAWDWINPATIKSYTEHPRPRMELVNDSVITFYTASDPNVTRSLECHDLWYDEYAYCPYQTWRVGLGAKRLKPPKGTRNSMWATGTPAGYDWSYGVFGEDGKKDHKVFETSIYENEAHLPKDYIKDMEAEYKGTDFEQQELHGKYTLFEGLIYPQFDGGNLWYPEGIPQFDIGVGGIDLGDIAPTVVVPAGIKNGKLWLPQEFYERRVTLSQLMAVMAQMEEAYNIRAWFCETTAEHFITNARGAGFDVRPTPIKDVEAGIRVVQQYLRDNRIMVSPKGNPNGMREMRTYQRKPQNLGESFSETIVKANDHWPDPLRYLVCGYDETPIGPVRTEDTEDVGRGIFDWGVPAPDIPEDVPALLRKKLGESQVKQIGSW